MKARQAVLVALAAAVTLTSVAAAGLDATRQAQSSSALDADVVSQWNAIAQAETVLLRLDRHRDVPTVAAHLVFTLLAP
jgi:hypothetical protein